jgi:hypothetical protein
MLKQLIRLSNNLQLYSPILDQTVAGFTSNFRFIEQETMVARSVELP